MNVVGLHRVQKCPICNQHTWTVDDGCPPCKQDRKISRRISLVAGALVVLLVAAIAITTLWAVDWDVKCWVSDKCRKVTP